jgi:hypothetical protein
VNEPLHQFTALILFLATLPPSAARAQLQTLPDKEPERVFAGKGRKITVIFYNPGGSAVKADLRTRLYQASSATAMPLGEAPWKKLEVLPGQSVLESASMNFPAVKAETPFVVQWVDGTDKLVGTSDVLVYPPDLLKDLKPLAGEEPLGVFDPQNQLKPLLKVVAAEFQDLEDTGLEGYHGKLAIIGPFHSRVQMGERLPNRIKTLAERGVAVVWIQPPPDKHKQLKPSFYAVPEGKGAVVVVEAYLASNLVDDPQHQLSLIQMARLALHPEPPQLPHLTPSH